MSVVTCAKRGVVDRRLGRVLAAAVVAQLDVAGVQLLVEAAEVVVLELEGLGELVDLAQVEAARAPRRGR